jgi:hypothetical protein
MRIGVIVVASLGLVALVLFAATEDSFMGVLAPALLFAAASAAAGGLFGFLFGVPRTASESGSPSASPIAAIRANTNLEQISDWLTKILIGATLVQLGKVPGAAARLFDAMAPALGDSPPSAAFAGGIVIYFAVVGFIGGWLATRLFLGRAMADALRAEAALLESKGDTGRAAELRRTADMIQPT